jgi:hypothetical protein
MHNITQLKLEDIILSEISQSQKDKYCVTILIRGTQVVKFKDIESILGEIQDGDQNTGTDPL